MAGLFDFPPFDASGSTGFLDPQLAYQAQASLLGPQGGQQQPMPQSQGMNWGGGSNLWPMLMSLGAGIASGGAPGGGGWGGGIGKGLALGQNQMQLSQNNDYKKLMLAIQMKQAEALEGYRNKQLEQGDTRNRLYEQSISNRPKSYQVDPNTGQLFDTTSGEYKDGAGEPRNPYFGGKLNETQGKTATFVDRMANSHKLITDLESINTTDSGVSTAAATLGLNEKFGNLLQSKERQKVVQAERDFVNAALRRESGAAISPQEFSNARLQYFPQVGDDKEVLAQKRRNRLTVMQGLAREVGPNYSPPEFHDPQENATNTSGASTGPLPFEKDPTKRKKDQVYDLPNGAQAIWRGIGWEPVN